VPIEVDPGDRAFRYAAAQSGAIEEKVVIVSGEKNRHLRVTFDAAPAASTHVAPLRELPRDAPRESGGPLSWDILLGTAGAVVLAGGVTIDLVSTSQVNHLRATCKPNCAQSDVDAVRARMIVGDVLVGAGVATVAVAAWLFLRHAH
jgi:hypothetical protein